MSVVRFLLFLLCLSLSPSSLSQSDSEALLAFKKPLLDPAQKLANWRDDSNPCNDKWEGILCKKDMISVERIHLGNQGLSGIIDIDALSRIKTLFSLSLANNSFEGPLPPFNKLNNLRVIYLQHNKFSGEIVGDFFLGTTFRRLWLSENEITGKIPESLVTLKSLSYLHLENNKFSGPILELRQNFKELDMSGNQLEGEVPASMEKYAPEAFEGNPGVCGKGMGSECKNDPPPNGAAQEINEPTPTKSNEPTPTKSNPKWTILIMLAIVGVIVVLLVLIFVVRSKREDDDDDEVSVRGKKRADDVVEVRVHGNNAPSRTANGGGPTKRSNASTGGGAAAAAAGTKRAGGDSSQKGRNRKSSQIGKQMGDLTMINEEKGLFGLADLMKAAAQVLGTGGLGSAYKAVMSNGVSVVVKRIKDMNNLGKEEFDTEIQKIGKLRNENILTPLAYHYRKEEKLVISEYISTGSLSYVLHGDRGQSHAGFNWPNRLKVIKGILSGIQYLQAEFPSYEVPHGNLKSSNVLLKENYEPLLCDYAFIRMVTPTQAAQGMFSYKSPEVVEGKEEASVKCDIYCLGIIILEMLTGKFPSQGGTDVIQWVRSSIDDKKEAETLDPEIASTTNSVDSMLQLLHLGVDCCSNNPNERPSLDETMKRLEKIQD